MEKYLVIVARDQPELWGDQTHNFAHAEGVEVVLDRRGREQRQRTHPAEAQAQGPTAAVPSAWTPISVDVPSW